MDNPILINMDIQSVRVMVHGLHITWLQYPVSFRKVFLCEGCLITSVTNLLAHQLINPLGLIAE